MNKHFYFLLLFPFVFAACNIINPNEEVPTYIHVEPFVFNNPDSSFTGSSFQIIPSARVSVDDITVGIFDLPCTVPVLLKKSGSLRVAPFVTNQGLKSYVFLYPFFAADTTTIIYNPGQVQHFSPKTKYSADLTGVSFRLKVNFEEGLLFRNLSGDTSLLLEQGAGKVLDGKYSGALYLNQAHKASESISSNYFDWPATPCYLELEYRSTIPFSIGLQAENSAGTTYKEYLAGFFPKDEHNKVYVELSTFTKANSSFSKFYITLRGDLNDNDGKYKEGYVLIDNIKVISR